jgi:hypothetical protein
MILITKIESSAKGSAKGISTLERNIDICSETESEENDLEIYVNKLQSQFKNMEINKIMRGNPSGGGRNVINNYERYINVSSTTRNWYPRPTTQMYN